MELKLTIEMVQQRNRAAGKHFFDYEWMQHFGTVIETQLLDNLCFVTSEQDKGARLSDGSLCQVWDGERRYTVRCFNPRTSEIETVGEFGQYKTLPEAVAAARKHGA